MKALVHPTEVRVVGDHRLWLKFEDGAEGEVDMSGHSWHGVFAPLEDPGYFERVRLDPDANTIAWPDGVDLAPETLYAWATGSLPMGEID